jgi:hypothetical protein
MVIRLTPKGLGGQRLGRGDFGIEQFGRHRPAGDHAKAARVADGGNEVALRNPAHRAAQDRVLGAEEFGPRCISSVVVASGALGGAGPGCNPLKRRLNRLKRS